MYKIFINKQNLYFTVMYSHLLHLIGIKLI